MSVLAEALFFCLVGVLCAILAGAMIPVLGYDALQGDLAGVVVDGAFIGANAFFAWYLLGGRWPTGSRWPPSRGSRR